jgi:putative oxidoreductase
MIGRVSEWVFRVALAGLFLYAGFGKLRDLQQFAIDVHNYRLTPWWLSAAVAVYLPWLEISSAIGLLIGRLYSGALATLGALSVVFTAVLGSAWARGIDISCGCLGKGGETSVAEALIRAVVILGVVGILGWRHFRKFGIAS